MGCGASAARRNARVTRGGLEQRSGIDGLPAPEQRRKLGVGSKHRARVTAALRDMPLLAHVSDQDLAEIVRRKLPEPFMVSDGTEIVSEGFVPALSGDGTIDGLFVLLDGAVHVVKTFQFGPQGVWAFRTEAQQQSCPFFGERVLCGMSGARAATVAAVGHAELLNVPRAVWTQVFTRAMGRVVEEQQMLQMQREYTLLLEGGHSELADEFGEDMQQFARDKRLPVPDVVEKSKGRQQRQRRGSVTKVVTRDELRANKRRASVCELDMAATQQRTRRPSAAVVDTAHRNRRMSVTENLISECALSPTVATCLPDCGVSTAGGLLSFTLQAARGHQRDIRAERNEENLVVRTFSAMPMGTGTGTGTGTETGTGTGTEIGAGAGTRTAIAGGAKVWKIVAPDRDAARLQQ